jgi:hypothetical protein
MTCGNALDQLQRAQRGRVRKPTRYPLCYGGWIDDRPGQGGRTTLPVTPGLNVCDARENGCVDSRRRRIAVAGPAAI